MAAVIISNAHCLIGWQGAGIGAQINQWVQTQHKNPSVSQRIAIP